MFYISVIITHIFTDYISCHLRSRPLSYNARLGLLTFNKSFEAKEGNCKYWFNVMATGSLYSSIYITIHSPNLIIVAYWTQLSEY